MDGKVRQNEEKIHSDLRLRYVFKFILLSEGILPVFWLKPEAKKEMLFQIYPDYYGVFRYRTGAQRTGLIKG